jgi:DNA polymerase-3 subunit gamma/tau
MVMYHAAMAVQALARSWRPATFDEVIGQDAVVTTLKNALGSDTLGQAYVFSGLRGVGKTTVARLVAKAVNCVEGPTAEPCGVCDSCQEVAAGSSLDVVELDGATHTQVDKVRDLQDLLRFSPTRDRYRVVIIDEVHMLSRSAFNALLKSIEEPPEYVIWIFATTESHKLPATILSRCQHLEFRPVPTEVIAARMQAIAEREGFQLDPGAGNMLARAAQGSVRDGLSLLDQLRAFSDGHVDERAVAEVLGIPSFEVLLELVRALVAGDAPSGLEILRGLLAAGHDPAVVYQELGRLLQELVHLAVDPTLGAELTPEQREAAATVARSTGLAALTRMIGLWLDHEFSVSAAAQRDLALEVACLRLSRWTAVQRVEALLADPGAATTPVEGTPPTATPSTGGSQARSAAEPDPLRRRAEADPDIELVRSVIGGDLVQVVPDQAPN